MAKHPLNNWLLSGKDVTVLHFLFLMCFLLQLLPCDLGTYLLLVWADSIKEFSLRINDDTQAPEGVFRVSIIASFVIVIQITLCARNTSWYLPVYALLTRAIQLLQAVHCEIGINSCLLSDNTVSLSSAHICRWTCQNAITRQKYLLN